MGRDLRLYPTAPAFSDGTIVAFSVLEFTNVREYHDRVAAARPQLRHDLVLKGWCDEGFAFIRKDKYDEPITWLRAVELIAVFPPLEVYGSGVCACLAYLSRLDRDMLVALYWH